MRNMLAGWARALGLRSGRRVRDPLSQPEHALLAPALRDKCTWETREGTPSNENELYEIFRRSPGASKWRHYFDVYAQAFQPLLDRPIRFLEIGVNKGGSLLMWRQYFHPDSLIVGIDNAPQCSAHDDPPKRIFVRIGEQQDESFLRAVIDEFGPFDIVVDDGSHIASHTLKSFNVLFASGMSERGVYVVEDLHTSYHPGFVDDAVPFMDVVKHLIDVMHAHYRDMHRLPRGAFSGSPDAAPLSVPFVTTVLDQIQVFDSIVVLHRDARRQAPMTETAKAAPTKRVFSSAS